MGITTFKDAGQFVGELVTEKNKAYGNSFKTAKEALKILYPNGIKPEQYEDVLLITRIWDKLMRIANQKEAFEESPYVDIAGYSLLGMVNSENDK